MPDPFAHVLPNAPVEFSATAWNAMLDAARSHRDGQFDRANGPLTTSRSSCLVRVRNDTGAPVGRAAVLGIDGPLWEPSLTSEDAFLAEVILKGVTPSADAHFGRFAVTLHAGGPDQVVRAWVAGVCPVRVDVVDPGHRWADVDDGHAGRLVSAPGGSAQILWKESDGGAYYAYGYGAGEQWALVRLGNPDGGLWGYLAEGNTVGGQSGDDLGEGTVVLCSRSGRRLNPDGPAVTVYNAGGDVTAGSGGRYLKINRMSDGSLSLDVFPCR